MGQPLITCLMLALSFTLPCSAAGLDPMAPPRPKPSRPAAPTAEPFMPAVLLWTLVGPGASYAWYGGRLVRPGDVIEGGRVHAIAEDHIVLLIGRRHERVPLIAPAPPARPHNPCPPDGRETCASSPAPESKP